MPTNPVDFVADVGASGSSHSGPEADLRLAERELAAYGAPFYLARTRLELGRWLLGHGRDAEASPLLQQAREAFVELKATPSLAELDALQPVGVA